MLSYAIYFCFFLHHDRSDNVKFDTSGYGEDLGRAPFENSLPEERFYNRTVVIDIIQ
ncbi:hypothetical protein [Pedobacter sp.]|uniref:hypothetical protein n=1 Tax=Pedobacter sp. TaxID=1411316 RepID=UPI003D7FAAF1